MKQSPFSLLRGSLRSVKTAERTAPVRKAIERREMVSAKTARDRGFTRHHLHELAHGELLGLITAQSQAVVHVLAPNAAVKRVRLVVMACHILAADRLRRGDHAPSIFLFLILAIYLAWTAVYEGGGLKG